MQGETCLALSKIFFIPAWESLIHLLNNSGPFTWMKFASDSFATAFAKSVFPVPGGPYNKIPREGRIPNLLKESGYFIGHSTASFNSCFISFKPPTSVQEVSGASTKNFSHCRRSNNF